MRTVIILIAAAILEVGGDALIRMGLQRRYLIFTMGAITLAVYGVVVNQSQLDFGRLMGAYIAVFFALSQIIAFAMFRVVPDFKAAIGGVLILAGGAVMMF